MQVKALKEHQFVKIVCDEITHFKIIPDKTIDNNTIIIARAAHELYSSPKDRFKPNLKDFNVEYKIKDRLFFDIIFTPGDAHFYLSCPKAWDKFIESKLKTIWPKCAISVSSRKDLNGFKEDISSTCDIRLRKHNLFAFNATTKSLDPLNSMFNVLKDLDKTNNEKIRISYVFDPINRLDWYQRANEVYMEYKKGRMPKRQGITRDDLFQNGFKAAMTGLDFYIQMKMLIIEGMLGFMGAGETREDRLEKLAKLQSEEHKDIEILKQAASGGLSQFTYNKINGCAFNSFIRVISQGADENKRITNMRTIANSFKDLNGDNEFDTVELPRKKELQRIKQAKEFDITDFWEDDVLGEEEVAKLLQLPQITLLNEYKIDSIDTRELELPEDLKKGYIQIGTATLKQKDFKTYWPTNKNVITLPKIIIGPMGSGKSEYIKRFCIEAARKRDSVILFDYIKNCELSEDISKHVKCIKINLSNQDNLFALAFPEVQPEGDNWNRLKAANILTRQIEYLLDSVIDIETGPLTAPMARYLNAACMVVFIHPGKTVDDVFKCLRRWQDRNEYIRLARYSNCFEENDEIFDDLEELNIREDEGRIIGTREHLIIGILNRISVLNKDIYIKRMLKAPINTEQNFCKYLDEGNVVLIQMPEKTFTNKQIKDTLVTYYMGRIWLAALQREGGKIAHVVIDEAHQVPTASNMISKIITEPRKFEIDFVFTVHFMKQFKALHDAIRSAGASYMLLSGTEKENLIALKEELKPFEIEEVMNLKPFHSLNIINYGNQYAKFISRLPPLLK